MVITKVYSTNIVTDNLTYDVTTPSYPCITEKKIFTKGPLKCNNQTIFQTIKIKQISWNKR